MSIRTSIPSRPLDPVVSCHTPLIFQFFSLVPPVLEWRERQTKKGMGDLIVLLSFVLSVVP